MVNDYRGANRSGRASLSSRMGSSHKTINVRLPASLADKFARLAAEIPGLPQSVMLRIIIDAYLQQELDDQVSGILGHLTKDGGRKPRKPTIRFSAQNNNRSH